MLGRGINHHIRPQIGRALQDRRGEDIVHDDKSADGMGQVGYAPDVDHFQRRVGEAFEEHRAGLGADRLAPLVQIGAIDECDLDPEAGQDLLQDIEARSEQRLGRHHVIARAQHRGQRAVDGGHSAGGRKGVLSAFKLRHPVLEHAHGGVAVAGIDELVRAAFDEACLGGLGAVIDETLGQVDRFAHLAILAAPRAAMHGAGARVEGLGQGSGALCHVSRLLMVRGMKQPRTGERSGLEGPCPHARPL